MNHASFSARTQQRAAALIAATALFSVVAPAYATSGGGDAGAAVLRTDLGVSLLNGSAAVPLRTTLNAVTAPEDADKSLLTAKLDGVHNGKPFEMLRADVANARATAHADKNEASSRLVKATVNLPGLEDNPLLEVEQVTSSAVCAKGAKPVAKSNVLGTVTVFGQRTELRAEGTTTVNAKGIGEVKLDLSQTATSSNTAAGTALHLAVTVSPNNLNVAKVNGHVTLVEAHCQTPGTAGDTSGDSAGQDTAGPSAGGDNAGSDGSAGAGEEGPSTQTGSSDLAETGSSGNTAYIAGGAAVLLVAGGALVLAKRRKATGSADA